MMMRYVGPFFINLIIIYSCIDCNEIIEKRKTKSLRFVLSGTLILWLLSARDPTENIS